MFLMICWEQCSIAYLLRLIGNRIQSAIFIWLQKQVNDIILIHKQGWNQLNARWQFCNVKRKIHRQSSPLYSPSFSIQPDWNCSTDSHFGQSKASKCSHYLGKGDVSIENIATASSKHSPSLRQEFFQSQSKCLANQRIELWWRFRIPDQSETVDWNILWNSTILNSWNRFELLVFYPDLNCQKARKFRFMTNEMKVETYSRQFPVATRPFTEICNEYKNDPEDNQIVSHTRPWSWMEAEWLQEWSELSQSELSVPWNHGVVTCTISCIMKWYTEPIAGEHDTGWNVK
jgi:hypothetical protein